MEIHHTKHHQAYITKVNEALEGTAFAGKPIEEICKRINEIPENIRMAVRNNGGGHANHSLFWRVIAPKAGGAPTGDIAQAIEKDLSGFEALKKAFSTAALTRFGSGWAWLSKDPTGKLVVESTPNQDSPLMHGNTPLLGLDVWEHAYYLTYQNRRPEYVEAFFNLVNWKEVNARFAS